MPTWGEIGREIAGSQNAARAQGASPHDFVRRRYLALASAHTGRATILYATRWTQPLGDPPALISITNEDVHGFMEAAHGLEGRAGLDLILHSPGGSPEAAAAVVHYLRTKFQHVRVVVPHMAMSAATMIACAADEIVMGEHSFLGPIDPQIVLNTSLGPRSVPAQAILEQFERAKEECQDPARVRAWLPMLGQYGPDLLVTCRHASELAEELVRQWLALYMFRRVRRGQERASEVAKWLATHSNFKSHGRPIPRSELRKQGLRVLPLEADQDAQDLFLSIYHTASHTFSQTGAAKIIENHEGRAFIKLVQQIVVQAQGPAQRPQQPSPPPGT
jgi:Serine dehydrogenase proteinase